MLVHFRFLGLPSQFTIHSHIPTQFKQTKKQIIRNEGNNSKLESDHRYQFADAYLMLGKLIVGPTP
jgi:hypothetical protein